MIRNEVFFRELLRIGRSSPVYWLRGAAPLAIATILLVLASRGDPQAGIHAFEWLTYGFEVFVLIAMPLLVSGILHEEWHSNTLAVLFLSDTSLGTVLRGILGSRIVLVLANLLACFPIILSVMSFGGVNAAQMFQFSTLLVSLAGFYGAFALWGACLIQRREISLIFIFACLGIPQLLGFFLYRFAPGYTDSIAWLPSVALSRLTEDVLPWTWWGEAAVSLTPTGSSSYFGSSGNWLSLNILLLAAAVLFFALARRRLEKAVSVFAAPTEPDHLPSPTPAKRSHKPIVGNPISWLVLKRFDPLFGIPKKVALVVTIFLAVGFEVVDTAHKIQAARHAVWLLGLVIMGWTFLWACLVSAQMWMEERTERTLELLLATPFTRDEVILWKVDALFWALVTPTAMYSVLVPAFLWRSANLDALPWRLFLLLPLPMCCFLYSYVALFAIVYVTIFFAIKANSAVQAVLSTLGFFGGLIFFNLVFFVGGLGNGLFLIALVGDVVLLIAFVPWFRKRLSSFEFR